MKKVRIKQQYKVCEAGRIASLEPVATGNTHRRPRLFASPAPHGEQPPPTQRSRSPAGRPGRPAPSPMYYDRPSLPRSSPDTIGNGSSCRLAGIVLPYAVRLPSRTPYACPPVRRTPALPYAVRLPSRISASAPSPLGIPLGFSSSDCFAKRLFIAPGNSCAG